LPIRTVPFDGEALDSWLEALAHRSDAPFGGVLTAVGLDPSAAALDRGLRALEALEHAQASAISDVTGISVTDVHALTLARYRKTLLRGPSRAGQTGKAFPWGPAYGSRYCPDCLAESSGRWRLSWRLAWSFACLRHQCLLADLCPYCAGRQRLQQCPQHYTPQPGLCSRWIGVLGAQRQPRCLGQLADAVVPRFHLGHPILQAQATIDDIINTGTAKFVACQDEPLPSVLALADIRKLAARLLAGRNRAEIDSAVGLDRRGVSYDPSDARVESVRMRFVPARKWELSPRAAGAAVGITVAVTALSTPSQRPIKTAPDGRRFAASPAEKVALGRLVSPIDELRYRSSLRNFPPTPQSSRINDLVRRTPTALWPAWALRLIPSQSNLRYIRPVLAASLLIIDTNLRSAEAIALLGSNIQPRAISQVLRRLSDRADWAHTRTAFGRLADYLADHDTPIDYQRRRGLDYSRLLPAHRWAQICRDTGTPGLRSERASLVRDYLTERLSGVSAVAVATGRRGHERRSKIVDFPRHLTPDLAGALEEHCREFLADNDIGDEPPFWSPPTDAFTGLTLPGRDPACVDIEALHHLLANPDYPLGDIAHELGTTRDVVRYLIETHPAATPPPLTKDHARVRGMARLSAKAALPKAEFVRIYHDERRSLREIAAHARVSRHTVSTLAQEYGIRLRPAHRCTRQNITRAWLYREYIIKQRALPELASQCNMSTVNMARWAHKHNIPVRRRGASSHRTTAS
jgi:hypothetical protein